MSTAKHTPGPWALGAREVVGEWGGTTFFRIVLPDGDVWECQASSMGGEDYERRRANTLLMVAAWDMYHALLAVATDEGLSDVIAGIGEGDPPFMRQVSSAIAKAEGRP